MSATIWKAVLRPVALQDIEVPYGAELLVAREQGDDICVWFRCDPERPKEKRRIATVGTGHPAPKREVGRYIGSALFDNGRFIFHVFEQAP